MAKHGMRVYSRKTGKPGWSNLYAKFSQLDAGQEKACNIITKKVARNIKRDTQRNIRQGTQGQSSELVRSVYYKKRVRKLPTHEVGVGAEYAEFVEFGTGKYNIFGKGRRTPWLYKSVYQNKFYWTEGQKPVMFFNNALNENLDRFPNLLKVEVGRMMK